jgi:uncharacterized protein YndB with AHSA1/START domain
MPAPNDFVATSAISIDAPPARVWQVITDPAAMASFFFGAEVVTDWAIGGPILWRGVWEGKPYEDKGEVVEFEPPRRLVTTHFSPLTGEPDVPENYHTLVWTLEPRGTQTVLTLSQDNNANAEAAAHSEQMWDSLVAEVKRLAEAD